MPFYHTNPNISIADIVSICNLKNTNLDDKMKLGSFVRPNVADFDDLTFFSSKKYSSASNAKYIVTSNKLSSCTDDKQINLISQNLETDIAKISNLFYRLKTKSEILKLDKTIVGNNSNISKDSIIDKDVSIGDNFSIDHFSSIDHSCSIGNNVNIGKNVSISNAIIGDNVSIGDGSKIGQTGFGFSYDTENIPVKIFHIGRVIIQNDVHISTSCTIDRGSFNDTIIGERTYIDNLVHIAHNVVIGTNCVIAGQCGFAGSANIGNFVQIGGQTGIGGHIVISDYVKIAAKSGIIRDIAKGETVMGYPAVSINKYLKNYKKLMM